MATILLSIANMTLASIAPGIYFSGVWSNATTGEVIPGSTVGSHANHPGAFLSYEPSLVSDELDEGPAVLVLAAPETPERFSEQFGRFFRASHAWAAART